jgi:Transposase DDE domain group 1
MDQGRQGRDQVDPPVVPLLRRECRPPSAPRAGLQPGQFYADAGDAKAIEPWSLTSLREKLIKIGAKIVSHGRYVTFQMAEVAVSRQMFGEILSLIARLRAPPAPA